MIGGFRHELPILSLRFCRAPICVCSSSWAALYTMLISRWTRLQKKTLPISVMKYASKIRIFMCLSSAMSIMQAVSGRFD